MTEKELLDFADMLIDEANYIRKRLSLHQTIDKTTQKVYRQVEELLK